MPFLNKQNIMDLHLYTTNSVYFNVVIANNLNQQLGWNEKLLELMKKSLGGKRKNFIVEF